jgi:hypothetical protein
MRNVSNGSKRILFYRSTLNIFNLVPQVTLPRPDMIPLQFLTRPLNPMTPFRFKVSLLQILIAMPPLMNYARRHFAMYRKEEVVTFKYPTITSPRMNFGRTACYFP